MFHIRTERIAAVSHLVTPHQRVSNIKLKGKTICRSHKETQKQMRSIRRGCCAARRVPITAKSRLSARRNCSRYSFASETAGISGETHAYSRARERQNGRQCLALAACRRRHPTHRCTAASTLARIMRQRQRQKEHTGNNIKCSGVHGYKSCLCIFSLRRV